MHMYFLYFRSGFSWRMTCSKVCLIMKNAAFVYRSFSTTFFGHMYITTRNCESDHSISRKFVKGSGGGGGFYLIKTEI